MPKGQDQGGALDRLRRRIDIYRNHHDESLPRYDNTTTSQNHQQKQETQLLRQRFLETTKAKKSAKKSDKNKQHSSDGGGSSTGPSKSNKRQIEDDQTSGADSYEPPSKISGSGSRNNSSPLSSNHTNSSLFKQGFSQNGKRKTKAVDSQKYTASSSTHPKNGIGRVSQPPPPIPPNNFSQQCTPSQANANPVTEFKKDVAPSLSDFADLAQCAAALEQDAAKNGAITGSFLGENSSNEIFNSDVFNDLISDLSDLNPEVMSDYCLDDRHPHLVDDLNDVSTLHGGGGGTPNNGTCNSNEPSFHSVTPVTPTTSSMRSTGPHNHHSGMKMEGAGCDGTAMGVHGMERGLSHCAGPSPAPASTASPLASQLGSTSSHQPSPSQTYTNSHYVLDSGQTSSPLNPVVNSAGPPKPSTRLPYPSPAGLSVDSPAAQTLKHMAEQHQHKAQMCISSNSVTNGGVSYKNQGSVGSPVGSPYMGNYNGSGMSNDYTGGPTGNMNPSSSNCQVKQEVCSPVNPQGGFSPSPMMDMASGGNKRPGQQHNGSSPSGPSSRIPPMNSAGGSPVMSPISKSFNHPSPMNTPSSQGTIPPPQHQSQQQPPQPPSYMQGMNRLPSQQPYNPNPRFSGSNNAPQISVTSPKPTTHVNERGSPASQVDPKPQHRLGTPTNMQQQPQQFSDQQFHYGNGQNKEVGFNPSGHPPTSQMQPQPQQPSSGQTINFTQQHLRMGGQPTGMHVSRMPIPTMNRMAIPQRLPGVAEMQQQQQPQRPMMDGNSHPQQRMMRPPPQGTRHAMMPPHQQMSMGGMQPPQAQMNAGPGMSNQMMNRYPSNMAPNPQMMGQHQSYNMGGNMPISGPGPGNMSMRRPYGPTSSFQGMNARSPGEQMLSSGSQNIHNSVVNSGVSHNDWMSNDNSCPPYPGPPQRQMRPSQQYVGMPSNQPGSQHPGNFCQPHHDHLSGPSNFPGQHHSQQHQLQQNPQQLPPNFNQQSPNSIKMSMSHHPQQQPQQMYGNSIGGYGGMKPPDGSNINMMCPPQQIPQHHPQIPSQQQSQQPPQQPHAMYNMGNTNNTMMNNSLGGNQMNSNVIPDQQDFNFDLLVNGIRNEGDHVDTTAFNDDLLDNLDAVFR